MRADPTTPGWGDWLLIGTLVALSWLAIFVAHDLLGDETATSVPVWTEYLLSVAMLAPLVWRRQRPLPVLVVVTVLSLVFWGLRVPDSIGPTAALFLALHAAGAYSDHPARDRLRSVAVVLTMLLVVYQLTVHRDFVGFDAVVFSTYTVAINVGYFAAGWLLGDAARRRREDQAELERRAAQLAAEQRERERRAVLDERVRIARELHDVVAHHVSVMGVQAGAARRVLGSDPAKAAEVLSAIEQSGREAVAELQRVVGFLRDAEPVPGPDGAGDTVPTPPQPTLADLEGLVESAGLPARLQHVGRPGAVPPAVEVSAYRIVQESLTNALKHAGQVPTTVVLTHGPDALRIEVVNERGTPHPDAAGSGRGIVGMRERVAMLGGRFEHGRVGAGGYRVSASLPLGSRPVTAPTDTRGQHSATRTTPA